MSNKALVQELDHARDHFCGIGTRKAKIRLNKLSSLDPVAHALRIALQIEDCNRQAKKYHGEWSDNNYDRKHNLIRELVFLFEEQGWTFGKQKSDIGQTDWIIYFEIPGCDQISFHSDIDRTIPDYSKPWDGLQGSTLSKLEQACQKLIHSKSS